MIGAGQGYLSKNNQGEVSSVADKNLKGLRKRVTLTPEVWDAMAVAWSLGTGAADLAKAHGVAIATVTKRMRKDRWGKRGWKAKELQALEEKYEMQEGGKNHVSAETATEVALIKDARRRHLALARRLSHKVGHILADKDRWTVDRASRTAVELSQVLERIVKVERLVLNMDSKADITAAVIIMVPNKGGDEQWHQTASQVISGGS